ncbi:MAG: permease [Polyangiaceae bacterium]
MFALLLSLVALACGPALTAALSKTPRANEFLDGLVLVALSGLVAIHILPHTVAVAGTAALLCGVLGFLSPYLLERLAPHGGAGAHRFLVPLVIASFGVHGFIDGAALVEHAAEVAPGQVLAIAIVLHRFPDGLAIWSVLRPARGPRLATMALACLGLLTVLGFVAGGAVLAGAAGHGLALLQSFVAGSVLHVIVHRPSLEGGHSHGHHAHAHDLPHAHVHDHAHGHGHDAAPPLQGLAAVLGAFAGLALLIIVTRTHPIVRGETGELAATATFVSLALEASPALLVSIAVSALVHAFLPPASRSWMSRGGLFSQAARGVLLAPALPQCSCGAVPLYRTMIAKGAPIAAAIALLIATPELGIPALLVSTTLLGVPITLARVAAAILAALVVGAFVARIAHLRPQGALAASLPPPPGPAAERLSHGLREAVADVVDHTGPWLVVGLVLGALFEPLARDDLIARLPRLAQVPLLAVAGMPLYVCASGATPLVAIMVHKGLSAGAAVAFLVTGPASNVTTFGVLAKLHGRKVALAYIAAITVVAMVAGYTIDATLAAVSTPSLHQAAAGDAYAWWNVASLVAVSALFLRSLVRLGPRRWFGQVLAPGAA